MIIVGDIACPDCESSEIIRIFFDTYKDIIEDDSILFNLEGLISQDDNQKTSSPVLYNHSKLLSNFPSYKNKVAALANNHTLDLADNLDNTKKVLRDKGIKSIGAGNRSKSDFIYDSIVENGRTVYIINACWDFLLYHQNNTKHGKKVNIINELDILTLVKELKDKNQTARIVAYFHWSFDLEILPSPSYRVFAKDLIDAGVSLVVGCHSHCVQGGEKYKDGYIAYGLGNFYIPSGKYANGKLIFPRISDTGWVIKWNVVTNEIQNIWIDSSNNQLEIIGVDDFNDSDILSKYSLYAGMSDLEYIDYFKKFRRKKRLIPIFYDYTPSLENKLKMVFLKIRAKIARKAAEMKLIGWQN